MHHTPQPHDPNDAKQVETIRAYANSRGAIMAISGYFCPKGTYWADVIRPGYATLATATTPLQAATAALRQFEHDNPA
jgi:hypothetical protein